MAKLNPYLNFDGDCREAMNFYKECLGGELTLQTVSSMPEMAAQMPEFMAERILHSQLENGSLVLMGSDCNMAKPLNGNTVQMCLNFDDEGELDRTFAAFSEGATIHEALTEMPWGAKYGSLTDKFEKHWVFNCPKG